MKKEIFTSAGVTFIVVFTFITIMRPSRIAELSSMGIVAYALVCALISTISVCLAIVASWKWLKLSRKRLGYWGRTAIGVITIPQLIVGISVLNAIAFDATPYQIMENAFKLTRNILIITLIIFLFDYINYRTHRNKEKRQRINKQVTLYKKYIQNTVMEQLIPITPTILVEANNILYASYDGYYTKVVYLDKEKNIKTRDIPVELERYIDSIKGLVPTFVQCHKRYAVNAIHMISIKMNWFGILRIHMKHTDFHIPANVEYAPNIENQ